MLSSDEIAVTNLLSYKVYTCLMGPAVSSRNREA